MSRGWLVLRVLGNNPFWWLPATLAAFGLQKHHLDLCLHLHLVFPRVSMSSFSFLPGTPVVLDSIPP